MTAFVGLLVSSGSPEPSDEEAIARGLAAVPGSGDRPAVRRGTRWVAVGEGFEEAAALEPAGSARPRAPGRAYVATLPRGRLVASEVRGLLATGLLPRRFAPEGLAGLLWRGAPMDAALPVRGVAAAPGTPASGRPPAPGGPGAVGASRGSTPETVGEALAAGLAAAATRTVLLGGDRGSALCARLLARDGRSRPLALVVRWPSGDPATAERAAEWARGQGLEARVVDGAPGDPTGWLEAHVEAMDLPSADGLEARLLLDAAARAGASDVVSGLGATATFGAGPRFASLCAPARRRRGLRRPRGGGDPFDPEAQRDLEVRALATVPVHRAHSLLAFLPAATRAALASLPGRPPDGVVPAATRGGVLASDLLLRGALPDEALRDLGVAAARTGVRVHLPFLDPSFASVARALPARGRFGAPGSGGWLRSALEVAPPGPVSPWEHGLEAWLRGPSASWLDAALAPDRLAAQGVWTPHAVGEAVRRWRAHRPGWTARHVLLLALTARWIEREGLADAGS